MNLPEGQIVYPFLQGHKQIEPTDIIDVTDKDVVAALKLYKFLECDLHDVPGLTDQLHFEVKCVLCDTKPMFIKLAVLKHALSKKHLVKARRAKLKFSRRIDFTGLSELLEYAQMELARRNQETMGSSSDSVSSISMDVNIRSSSAMSIDSSSSMGLEAWIESETSSPFSIFESTTNYYYARYSPVPKLKLLDENECAIRKGEASNEESGRDVGNPRDITDITGIAILIRKLKVLADKTTVSPSEEQE